jgi:AcrR family transcriptional regulator
MSSQSHSARQRLIQAALELFTTSGVSGTTTRQIAEKAEVNEVTLFRHFGNKHGLLLAVLEESAAFKNLGESLVRRAIPPGNVYQALKDYASESLHALEQVPEFVRSVVGEADQYPAENRRALGRGLTEANRYVAEYLATVIEQGHLNTYLPAEKLASLLNGMLLGYAVIEFTSEFHELWEDRDDFLENLVQLFLQGAMSPIVETSQYSSSLTPSNSATSEKIGSARLCIGICVICWWVVCSGSSWFRAIASILRYSRTFSTNCHNYRISPNTCQSVDNGYSLWFLH